MYEGYADEISYIKAQMNNELDKKVYHQKEMYAAMDKFNQLVERLRKLENESKKG